MRALKKFERHVSRLKGSDQQTMSGQSPEDDFISRYFAPIAGKGSLGLRDDAALLDMPAGCELVVTVDTLVAGVHFFDDDPAASIARKALRVNLSDLAAKGAGPAGFLLSFATPSDVKAPSRSDDWMSAFSSALGADAQAYDCPLLGGDSVTTPGPLTLSVTAFGFVPAGKMVRRTGAREGDKIYVTGTIGDAALGLQFKLNPTAPWLAKLSAVDKEFLVQRYLEPQPRNVIASVLLDHVHGAMDVSDGLAGDLAKMMRASGTSARCSLQDLPLSVAGQAAVKSEASLLETAVTGGDDYEILCTVAPDKGEAFQTAAASRDVAVTCIGVVQAKSEQDAVFVNAEGREHEFVRASYSHL